MSSQENERITALERKVAKLARRIAELEQPNLGELAHDDYLAELEKRIAELEEDCQDLRARANDSSNAHQRALTDRVNMKAKLGML